MAEGVLKMAKVYSKRVFAKDIDPKTPKRDRPYYYLLVQTGKLTKGIPCLTMLSWFFDPDSKEDSWRVAAYREVWKHANEDPRLVGRWAVQETGLFTRFGGDNEWSGRINPEPNGKVSCQIFYRPSETPPNQHSYLVFQQDLGPQDGFDTKAFDPEEVLTSFYVSILNEDRKGGHYPQWEGRFKQYTCQEFVEFLTKPKVEVPSVETTSLEAAAENP